MQLRLSSLSWLTSISAALITGACSATHTIGENPNNIGGTSSTATGGGTNTIGTGGSVATSCPNVEPQNGDACGNIGLFCSYGAFSCPYHYTCNANGVFERSPATGCYPFPGTGGTSSVASLAAQTIAACNIPVTGAPSEQQITLPSELTGPNWSIKASNCQQGGWDLAACAGQAATFTSFATSASTQWGALTAWVVTLGNTVCCVYESDNSNPGIYPAACGNGGAPGSGGRSSVGGAGGTTATGGNAGSGGAVTGGNSASGGANTGGAPVTSVDIRVVTAQRVDLSTTSSSGATIVAPPKSGLNVVLATSVPVYQLSCTGANRLSKGNGSAILDERPMCGTSAYYMGDTYVANGFSPACMGCDVIWCQPLNTNQTFVTYDIVKTSERSLGDAGATLGVYEIRPTTGPYLLTIDYFTDAKCASAMQTTGPMSIDIQ